jgi:hypothetical protein
MLISRVLLVCSSPSNGTCVNGVNGQSVNERIRSGRKSIRNGIKMTEMHTFDDRFVASAGKNKVQWQWRSLQPLRRSAPAFQYPADVSTPVFMTRQATLTLSLSTFINAGTLKLFWDQKVRKSPAKLMWTHASIVNTFASRDKSVWWKIVWRKSGTYRRNCKIRVRLVPGYSWSRIYLPNSPKVNNT